MVDYARALVVLGWLGDPCFSILPVWEVFRLLLFLVRLSNLLIISGSLSSFVLLFGEILDRGFLPLAIWKSVNPRLHDASPSFHQIGRFLWWNHCFKTLHGSGVDCFQLNCKRDTFEFFVAVCFGISASNGVSFTRVVRWPLFSCFRRVGFSVQGLWLA